MKRGTVDAASKQVVIDADSFRVCVALIEDDRVVEFHIEREDADSSGSVGNIYRGRIQNVLPGMSAAFVDIGEEKNAFLCIDDINAGQISVDGERVELMDADKTVNEDSPEPEKTERTKRRKKAADKVKPGQELMVQVIKEAYGTKSARLSTNISLAGHMLIYMPTVDACGVSRRITSEKKRNELKELMSKALKNGEGVIVRTAAAECDEDQLCTELEQLRKMWRIIAQSYDHSRAPKLIYKEDSLLTRTLRDFIDNRVERIVINSGEHYKRLIDAASFMNEKLSDRIELRSEGEKLFEEFGIERQLKDALSRRVWLKSGAYIVIDQTEALVSIDVNTGKNSGGSDPAQMIVKTNCEAAIEIAHQMRLRDLSGIIVIDFIDMTSKADRDTVVATLRGAVKYDRNRTTVYRMTELGLVQVARKKQRQSLSNKLLTQCPYCGGLGKVLSNDTTALMLIEQLKTRACAGLKKVIVCAQPELIARMQEFYKTPDARKLPKVLWESEPAMPLGKFDIKVIE